MKLGRAAKIGLIVLTILPFIYLVLFMAATFWLMASNGQSIIFNHWNLFFGLHLGVMLLGFCLIAFYIVYLFKTQAVKQEQKALWAVVLFMGWPIAAPIFWYLYIWRDGTS